VIESGKPLKLSGFVGDPAYLPSELSATWSSSLSGLLGAAPPDATGKVELTVPSLPPGQHVITLTATSPKGAKAQAAINLGVCGWQAATSSFDAKLDSSKWKTYGDAYWDPGGWLEMTGNAQGKKGQIFNVVEVIQPGDVQLSFDIQTGGFLTSGGQPKGADGFAMSVVHVPDVTALEDYIGKAQPGGCLGYGVAGGCSPGMAIEAFHLEIDTWHNDGDPVTDPTPGNHLAVTENGDPGKHKLWAAVPAIEDLQWHTVTVQVAGAHVTVKLDGQVVMDDTIADFKFRGGYIGFSGSTGWATNWHRFDNLQILQTCVVP
jgi:hypothetical protein